MYKDEAYENIWKEVKEVVSSDLEDWYLMLLVTCVAFPFIRMALIPHFPDSVSGVIVTCVLLFRYIRPVTVHYEWITFESNSIFVWFLDDKTTSLDIACGEHASKWFKVLPMFGIEYKLSKRQRAYIEKKKHGGIY